jgi:hypothetical protein
LLVMLILFKIYKKCCKSRIKKFSFQLEIANEVEYCYIHALDLSGAIKDYVVEAQDFITNIQIRGGIRPYLKFHWASLKIKDQATMNEFKIKNKLQVSWAKAHLLKRILRGSFKCNPVFLDHLGKVRRVALVNTAEGTRENIV